MATFIKMVYCFEIDISSGLDWTVRGSLLVDARSACAPVAVSF